MNHKKQNKRFMRDHQFFEHCCYWLCAGSMLILSSNSIADETEIFFQNEASRVNSNLLFLLDASGSMEYLPESDVVASDPTESRMAVLRQAFKDVMSNAPEQFNVGLMHYGNMGAPHQGGTWKSIKGISFPVSPIEATADSIIGSYLAEDNLPDPSSTSQTVRDFLPDIVDSWTTFGYTPIVDSLYEAARYYRGDSVFWGRANSYAEIWAAHPSALANNSSDLMYDSPVEYQCQKNYIVLMSDGSPSHAYFGDPNNATLRYPESARPDASYDPDTIVPIVPDRTSADFPETVEDMIGNSCTPGVYNSGLCGPELTNWLASTDQSDTFEGDQFVDTYTIAFAMRDSGKHYMRSLATVPGGSFSAENYTELKEVLFSIFDDAGKRSLSFSTPTLSVDQSKILSNGKSVYMPVFNFANRATWSGNLRKFELKDGKIVDVNGETALTTSSGLVSNAQDLWSDAAHGEDVQKGGAAHHLPAPSARELYTDNRSTSLNQGTALQRVLLNSDNVSADMIIPTGTDNNSPSYSVDTLINFIRGYKEGDPDLGARNHMGDIINSKPLVVDYGQNKGTLVFIGTNEGYLHAIDAETGVEQWAYMPSKLLPNQLKFFENELSTDHVWGIDGPLTVWKKPDEDQDGSPDQVMIFFGLREGGSAYYALDVTDPNSPPKLEWLIDENSSDFSNLGRAWSVPTLSYVTMVSNSSGGQAAAVERKPVLVFGAGYDPNKDEENLSLRASTDSVGTDVYIVDAETGSKLWAASDAYANTIKHGVAGDIRILDLNNNGALDRLYFADTGGNVWRADIDDQKDFDSADKALWKIATLGGSASTGEDHRKFFNEPDVSTMIKNGQLHIKIALGSGYRTHPLNTKEIANYFYVINDPAPQGDKPENWTPITHSDLVDVSSSGANLEADSVGWKLRMALNGEKVLAPSITIMNKVMFTTFALADESGSGSTVEPCKEAETTARAYVVDLATGQAVFDLGGSGSLDRSKVVAEGEIMGTPQLVFGDIKGAQGACSLSDCEQEMFVMIGKDPVPLLSNANTVQGSDDDYKNRLDLNRLLPRMYWLDRAVSEN